MKIIFSRTSRYFYWENNRIYDREASGKSVSVQVRNLYRNILWNLLDWVENGEFNFFVDLGGEMGYSGIMIDSPDVSLATQDEVGMPTRNFIDAEKVIDDLPRGTADKLIASTVSEVVKKLDIEINGVEKRVITTFLTKYSEAIIAASELPTRAHGISARSEKNIELIETLADYSDQMFYLIFDNVNSEGSNSRLRAMVGSVWELNEKMMSNSALGDISNLKVLRDLNSGILGMVSVAIAMEENGLVVELASIKHDLEYGIDMMIYASEEDADSDRPAFLVDAKSKRSDGLTRGEVGVSKYRSDSEKKKEMAKNTGYSSWIPHLVINFMPHGGGGDDLYKDQVLGIPNEQSMSSMWSGSVWKDVLRFLEDRKRYAGLDLEKIEGEGEVASKEKSILTESMEMYDRALDRINKARGKNEA